ncbi:glycoside hydrolase family 43 protein [Niabella aquatica]
MSCSNVKNSVNKESKSVDDSIDISRMLLRDPFVFYDKKSRNYYTYANNKPGIKAYSSKDLTTWKDIGNVFTANADFWGKTDFWAPDCYYYKGKYYLFVTFSDANKKRGTSVLVSDFPHRDFKPLVNAPVTPKEWMCLDAALYTDKENNPWMIFCREWLEVSDGEIYAQRLSHDLKSAVGSPVLLFKASSAPWVKGIYSAAHNQQGNVTDAPFVYRMKDGTLLMLWSSFDLKGKYAIGVAYSVSGRIEGPWEQSATTLNSDDGGHGMLFNTRDGDLKISYHAPNSKAERLTIKDVKIENGMLSVEQ